MVMGVVHFLFLKKRNAVCYNIRNLKQLKIEFQAIGYPCKEINFSPASTEPKITYVILVWLYTTAAARISHLIV